MADRSHLIADNKMPGPPTHVMNVAITNPSIHENGKNIIGYNNICW